MDPMFSHLRRFPEMWDEIWGSVRSANAFEGLPAPSSVLLCGMGGSSIGAALLEALAYGTGSVPIALNRRYVIPSWAGPETLVVCTSYSGNTEETLAAFDAAGRQGCMRFCVTSGGELGRRAKDAGVPVMLIPGGLPPRAALPYTLVPQLHLANVLRIVSLTSAQIDETGKLLHRLAAEYGDSTPNEATIVADYLTGRIPVVYSGTGLLSAVNLRWRGQIQENAKTPAYGNVYPELNHNEIEAWESRSDFLKTIAVVELASSDDPPEVRKRMDVTRGLLEEKAAGWYRYEAQGTSPLAQLLSGVVLGDWVSYYLASNLDVDPMPVALIDALKKALAGG